MRTEVGLTFHPLFPWFVIAAMGFGLAAFTVLSYRRTYREIPVSTKSWVILFRILAVTALLVCFLQPSLTLSEIRKEKGWVVWLIDSSRSMRIRDMVANRSRGETVEAALAENRGRIEELASEYAVQWMVFDRQVRDWDRGPTDWAGSDTAIGTALAEGRRLARGRRVAGIVLISDGANNYGPDPVPSAAGLRGLDAPLYAFGVGTEEEAPIRDLRVLDVIAPVRVFSGNKFPVVAELHALGLQGETAEVELVFGGTRVGTETVSLTSNDQVTKVRFMHRATVPGQHALIVRANRIPGEMTEENNQDGSYVQVLEGGLQVLLLEGKLRTEFGFLRRALESDSQVVLNAPLPFQVSTRERMAAFLGKEDLEKYHVVVLGDIPSSVFATEALGTIRRAVGNLGAGLAMLGGYESLGPGGYASTPLGDVLPVIVSPKDPQVDQATTITLTPDGRRHFMMVLDSDPVRNAEVWAALPRLKGYTQTGRPRPAATVLAVSESQSPLVVVQQYGQGRSAAIMADTTYRWALGQAPEKAAAHRKFWRQVTRWLASVEKVSQKALRVNVEKFSYILGETVHIEIELTDEKGSPVSEAQVALVVDLLEGEPKTFSVPVTWRGQSFGAAFIPPQKGVYRIQAKATHGEEVIGPQELRFRVTVPDRELDAPQPDAQLLKSLAEASGGRYHRLRDLPNVLDEILEKRLSTEIRREQHRPLWDSYPVFALFVLGLMGEWILRRQRGLV